ncbi:site-specific integrase [Balneola sp. MJW-20]|uniref:site-specific integrase n=1 Tax=Gracilimonas aurantiaca TaxID=3234185 RepID=UPI0034672CF5
MAIIKAVLSKHPKKDGRQLISIRISHKGKNRYVNTGYSVHPKYFKKQKVSESHPNWMEINNYLDNELMKYRKRNYELIHARVDYNVDDICNLSTSNGEAYFLAYANAFISEKQNQYSPNSIKNYLSIVNKFDEYLNKDIQFFQLNEKLLHDYVGYLKRIGNNNYTIKGNLKVLKRIWHEAYQRGNHNNHRSPFNSIKIKIHQKKKPRLTADELKLMKNIELKKHTWEELSRDMFLASYYLGGMRFSDLCVLTKEMILGNHLVYHMRKTEKEMRIPVDDVVDIIEKYDGRRERLIFPLLDDKDIQLPDELLIKKIASKNTLTNKGLKKVARLMGSSKNITCHVARHSFAETCNQKDAKLILIKEMLGHSKVKVTEQYLGSIDREILDAEFRRVFKD